MASVDTTEKIVAITFDDGPWNIKYTTDVIQTLDSLNVKATFFLNGRGIEQNFDAAKNLVLAGHQIGNHGYSHQRLVFKGFDTVKNEIESTNALIREIGYENDIYFRPPYGSKLFVLPYYLKQHDITTVTWDLAPETFDGAGQTSSYISNTVIENAVPGSIILLHVLGSGNSQAREALKPIVEGLRAKGFRFVTLSELLGKKTSSTVS